MSQKVDLRALAVCREDAPASAEARHSWHVGTRLILPGLILFCFCAVVGWSVRDHLLPAQQVLVVPVVTTYSNVQNEGMPIFQAAGWIEPRPTPILVTALTEGVVEKLLVVEGEKIKEGHVVARLIQDDVKLALQLAESDRELREAEVEHAQAVLSVMRAALPSQLQAARSHLALSQQTFDSRKELMHAGATPYLSLPKAKSDLDAAMTTVAELEIRQGTFKAEGIRPFAEAEANVKSAIARLKQAETGVALARLRVARTTVTAPVSGQVITLVAKPGQRLMGQSPFGHQEASTVVTMFDPGMIQVRVDVRVEDVPKVQGGQRVTIDTPVTPDRPLEGEVLQMTSQADIQKNTLQVKVSIRTPPPTLRPDMLVQVTFLALPLGDAVDGEKQSLRIMVPKQLVESAEGNAYIWVADLAGKVARKRLIKPGRPSGDFVEVVQGLNPTDRLITEGRQRLGDGQRIAVTHADTGIESMRHDSTPLKRLSAPTEKKVHSGKH